VSARPLVIAHRTCPLDAPENSAAGIDEAASQGADLVEIDVRITHDGKPVLCHDAIPVRTLWWPRAVRSSSYDALNKWSTRRGRPLLTLPEALTLLPPGLGVAIDVKDPAAIPTTLDAVRSAGLVDRVLVWCRDGAAIARIGETSPVQTALLRNTREESATLRYLDDAVAVGAQSVSLHQRATTPATVEAGHDRGLVVHSWVVSTRAHDQIIDAGVDSVVTDWPALARRAIAAQFEPER
jgi:glycerophosphoryl diester phosphodiesterase